MRIGIKYCGGCNSTYDRKIIVNRLLAEYKDISIENAKPNYYYEIILIISGCLRACVNHDTLKGKHKIFITSENDYDKIKEIIEKMQMSK